MKPSICEKCQKEIADIDWPFCPHEKMSGRFNAIDDTLPGGPRMMWNLGDTGVWIETKTELKRIMLKRGLVQAERNVYNKADSSPWATKTRLKPGQRDPFIHRSDFNR